MSKIKVLLSRYRKLLIVAGIIIVIILAGAHFYFHVSLLKNTDRLHVYVDDDDDIDSVYAKIRPHSSSLSFSAFKTLAGITGYDEHVRTGHYEIKTGDGALSVLRRMKNGVQTPVRLVVSPTWTVEMECARLARQLACDSAALTSLLKDPSWCRQHGYDTATVAAIFLPDNYEVYWNTNPEVLLERMIKEHDSFWNEERMSKAKALNLSPNAVTTLASIVDAETADNEEKPTIAGLYYNRLEKDMLLQADPTVKFALRQFGLKRIYNSMLRTQSPYNTYVNKGLPPGPIRIATKEGIDAVLNMKHHPYIYMCAKEDFSGRHNFAVTYAEHQANAARYTKALNQRKIK